MRAVATELRNRSLCRTGGDVAACKSGQQVMQCTICRQQQQMAQQVSHEDQCQWQLPHDVQATGARERTATLRYVAGLDVSTDDGKVEKSEPCVSAHTTSTNGACLNHRQPRGLVPFDCRCETSPVAMPGDYAELPNNAKPRSAEARFVDLLRRLQADDSLVMFL